MRHCDVAVIGLGLMGAAALDALLRSGADALGFDPRGPGAAEGSSHGSSRVFRRYSFENSHYTDLSEEARAGWDALAERSGREILIPCPVLEAGPKGSAMVAGSRAAVLGRGLPDPAVTIAEVNARFPAFDLPDTWEAVIQDGGAILLAQNALEAMRARAMTDGRLFAEAAEVEARADHVMVRTASQTVIARRAILAVGPWTGRHLPQLGAMLKVTRQVVGWFTPARPADVGLGRFPIFLLARSETDVLYGFPDFEGRGVKAGPHDHGPAVDADAWGPGASDEELRKVGAALAALVPGAAGPIGERDVCLYTNTPAADLRADGGEEFIIDRWPNSRLIVASACSGHGAKFAPAIGERLAKLAVDPGYEVEPYFQLSRYSRFARSL